RVLPEKEMYMRGGYGEACCLVKKFQNAYSNHDYGLKHIALVGCSVFA
ncbi:16750_t:CDS:1, partial [Funneliformis geosporum]